MPKYRLVLDYGHGGSKAGAVYQGVQEKSVNFLTGRAIYEALHKQKGNKSLQVLLTRDADYDIPLRTRCELINRHHDEEAKIQLVLSVHYNAAGSPEASGFEAYCVASSHEGRLAAEHVTRAVRAAGILTRRNPVRTTAELGRRLAILHNTKPPAVLIEVGFLTHPIDRNNAVSPRFRAAVAQATSRGIWNYLLGEGASDA